MGAADSCEITGDITLFGPLQHLPIHLSRLNLPLLFPHLYPLPVLDVPEGFVHALVQALVGRLMCEEASVQRDARVASQVV